MTSSSGLPWSGKNQQAECRARSRTEAILFSGSFVSAVNKKTRNNLYDVKSWAHKFSGSFGSVVDKRTSNDLYKVKFSGSFGSVGDIRTRNDLKACQVLGSYI